MTTRNGVRMSRWSAMAAAAVLLSVGALAGTLFAAKTGLVTTGPVFEVAAAGKTPANATQLAEGFSPVVKQTLPAVVNISSSRMVKMQNQPMPFMDPFFGRFFGFPDENHPEQGGGRVPQRRERGLGSGVIVSHDGYILTNDHVVNGASDIEVTLSDKRDFKAKLVGTDPKTDIAVLRIEASNLPYLKLGDSSALDVGDLVLAVGNPFGIGQTVTMGIVSAVARHPGLDNENYENFIQTDAAINPGNSGGALVNVHGDLVGINTAILSRGGGNQGIGFAVPSNMARNVMEQILKNGKVVRGWLGVSIQPVNPAIGKAFGYDQPRGALVGDVTEDSPAAKAGVHNGDIIVEMNGKTVEDTADLRLKVAMSAPGTKVNLKIFREGKMLDVPVTLGELPGGQAQQPEAEGSTSQAMEGVQVQDLTPQLARQLGLASNAFGVVVSSVAPNSPAADAGLRRGDVIQQVNRRNVSNVAAFRSALQSHSGPVVLLVNRGGSTMFLVVESQ